MFDRGFASVDARNGGFVVVGKWRSVHDATGFDRGDDLIEWSGGGDLLVGFVAVVGGHDVSLCSLVGL